MQEIEEKKNLIDKVSISFKENKLKIIILISTILLIIVSFFFFNFYNDKKNILISEKFIQASIYLSSKKKEESKKLLDEIIYEKNPFYSVLALNLILEKLYLKGLYLYSILYLLTSSVNGIDNSLYKGFSIETL